MIPEPDDNSEVVPGAIVADEDELPEIKFLRKLTALGQPIWLAKAYQHWEEYGFYGSREFRRPLGWQRIEPQPLEEVLAGFYYDDGFYERAPAVCVNMGGATAVVDVDIKNGGDVAKVRNLLAELKVRIFAEIITPSGGVHFYIAGHADLPTVHSNKDNQKLPGFPGVDIQSFRANVFTVGTDRWRKDPEHSRYQIVFDDLDALINEGDPIGAERLAEWVAIKTASHVVSASRARGSSAFVFDPAPRWNGGTPDRRQQNYLNSALAGEAKRVAETKEGGRNFALNVAALKLGHYVAGAGLKRGDVIRELRRAADECGLVRDDGERSVNATINSGLRAGVKTPRAVPPPRKSR